MCKVKMTKAYKERILSMVIEFALTLVIKSRISKKE